MERSKQRGDEKAALQKKLMMKLYLEGLKAKTRKAKAAASAAAAAGRVEAPARRRRRRARADARGAR